MRYTDATFSSNFLLAAAETQSRQNREHPLWQSSFLTYLLQGSLYYEPKQSTIKGKSLKSTIYLHCLIIP